ncbi:hypothetical protein VPH35_075200 [Triticum aestivum]
MHAREVPCMVEIPLSSKKRLLFDVSSGNIRGISSTLFPDAFVEFENRGWLLMQIVFLVHPTTGRRIHLPVLHSPNKGYFVFYVDPRGAPLVVACVQIKSVVPTVHVTCHGDVYWCVHKHTSNLHPSEAMRRPMDNTWILDRDTGHRLSTEMTWRTASCPEWSIKDAHYLVASNGEVVIVSCLRVNAGSAFKFFKMDMEALEWSPLDGQELDDTSWFLCKGQSIRVKEEGKRKVYTFNPIQCSGSVTESSHGKKATTYFTSTSGPPSLKTITNIYAYDLVSGTVETVIPASIVTEVRRWIQPSMFATPTK